MLFNETDKKLIRDILVNQHHYYHTSYQRKPGKKKARRITAPHPIYIELQEKLADWFQTINLFPISATAHGWIKGRSTESCAEVHVANHGYLIESDISSFFDNISDNHLKKLFGRLKLTGTDRIFFEGTLRYLELEIDDLIKLLTVPVRRGHPERMLPQGFVTSGYLANAVRYDIDVILEKLCYKKHWNYSTYGDNIFISGKDVKKELKFYIQTVMKNHGFEINLRKTRVSPYFSRQIVLGYTVNEKLRVNQGYIKKTLNGLYQPDCSDGSKAGKLRYVTSHYLRRSQASYLNKKIEVIRMSNTISYDRQNGCGYCHGKVTKLFKTYDSDVVCENCGAVYYSYENSDVAEPGSFTGRYEPLEKDKLYQKSMKKEN